MLFLLFIPVILAINFFNQYQTDQEEYYSEDLNLLGTVTKPVHMKGNQLLESFQ